MVVNKRKRRRVYKKTQKVKKKKWGGKAKLKNIVCGYYCRHEKCHHLKCVKYLRYQKKKFNINFFASLLPYHQIFHQDMYGIIKGMTDFFIDQPLKNKSGKILKTSLYIELKVGSGTLTPDEKIQIRKILQKGESGVGVCFGINSFKALVRAWRNRASPEEIEALCWAGRIKKKDVFK